MFCVLFGGLNVAPSCNIKLRAKEIKAWVMLSKPLLIAFNGALFRVTTRQLEHAKNVSIKANCAETNSLISARWPNMRNPRAQERFISSWRSRFLHRFKAMLRKGLKLVVQLLTLAQISDESDTQQPENGKQQRIIQPEESTHNTAITKSPREGLSTSL